jgi:hypothetical protein
MSRLTRVGLLAGATALTVTGVSVASPAVEGMNEADRIQQLEARIAELEGRNNDNWLNERRTDEIRSIVHDVLADADTRASLLGSGMTSGYDNGFHIGSADGNFSLRLNGQLQTRWIYNYRSGPGDSHRSGFENARTKLWFSGHIVNPQWEYMVEFDFARATGTATLLDAYIGYDYGNGFSVRAGQMKMPFMGENLIDSRYQQAVERSLVASSFGGARAGRAQGIALEFEQDMFRLTGMWSEGMNVVNSPWNAFTTEWALTGRAEILAAGTWDQFDDFRSMAGEETGVKIGVAAHWQHTEYGILGSTKTEVFGLTADVNAKFGGFNLFGSFVWMHNDIKGGGSADPWGFTVQGGYNFTDEWEGFVRYEWTDFDTAASDLSILTWGVNHYFAGHNAKATVDMGYSFNTLPFITGNNRAGYRVDSGTNDGQFVIRTQLQLAF